MCDRTWLRLYTRMIDSPQVIVLSDTEFRLLISLWCLANASPTRGTVFMSVAAIRRRVLPDCTPEEVAQMLTHLTEEDLLAGEEGSWHISRWETHQYTYPSDRPQAQKKRRTERATITHDQARRAYSSSGDRATIEPPSSEEVEEERKPEGEARVKRKPPPFPSALTIFRDEARRNPPRSWAGEIMKQVGTDPVDLERWRQTVHAWLGMGWNPANVQGMLECFVRGEIPGVKTPVRAQSASKGPVDEWLTMAVQHRQEEDS